MEIMLKNMVILKYICVLSNFSLVMEINRIKAVLAENGKKNKWLSAKMRLNEATVSKWCTNASQPSLKTLVKIAKTLDVNVRELIVPTK